MTLQKDFENSKVFDENIRIVLLDDIDIQLTESSVNRILHFIHKSNYLQILYMYHEPVICKLLNHFTEVEDYDQCILIRDTVKNHNKATGDNIILQTD